MSSHSTYDVCVIGAGVVGSSTAHYLASRGQNTLLLEQFPLPHWRGSSHGQTRIIRGSYQEPYYTKMVGEAREMWIKIQAKSQQEIIIPNLGMLTVEKGPGEELEEIKKSLAAAGERFQVLSNKNLKKRFPDLSFSPHYTAVLEESAGLLRADKCLKVLQEQFVEFGGTLKDGESVVEVLPGSPVTIKTTKNLFTANKVIFTAGPWTNKLLKPLGIMLPLMPCLAKVYYWRTKQPGTYSLRSGYPTFFDCTMSGDSMCLYGIPSFEYPDLVKFGPTGQCRLPAMCKNVDPDSRDSDREVVEIQIQKIREYIQDHFPQLDHREPAIIETCIYTLTPDNDFVLDKHPRFPNIVIGAGFSAHGFKLGPVSGKILAQLALGETPSYDLSPFKMTRFNTIRNLLRSGAITKAWEPVWFPVVEAFPPLLDTKVNRKAEAGRMQNITYPEDKFRKEFYKRFEINQPLYLWGNHPSHCDRLVEICMQHVQQGMNDEEAFENAVKNQEFGKIKTTMSPQEDDWDLDDILDDKDMQADYPLDDNLPDFK